MWWLCITTDFSLCLPVKDFFKSVNIWRSYRLVDCFTCPILCFSCTVLLKGADLSRSLAYIGQKLLLIVVFSINKYEDAVDQFDSLTDRLTLSVTDRPLVNCGFLPRHLFLCRGSCGGGIFLAWPLRVSL